MEETQTWLVKVIKALEDTTRPLGNDIGFVLFRLIVKLNNKDVVLTEKEMVVEMAKSLSLYEGAVTKMIDNVISSFICGNK